VKIGDQLTAFARKTGQVLFHPPIQRHVFIDAGVMLANCFNRIGLRRPGNMPHRQSREARYEDDQHRDCDFHFVGFHLRFGTHASGVLDAIVAGFQHARRASRERNWKRQKAKHKDN
jgi:hypothetical protein